MGYLRWYLCIGVHVMYVHAYQERSCGMGKFFVGRSFFPGSLDWREVLTTTVRPAVHIEILSFC